MSRAGGQFAAVLSPQGVSIVRYTRVASGYEVKPVASIAGPVTNVEDVLLQLAATLASEGGRRGSLAILVNGLASYYDRLTLPIAPPAILAQVVQREMARRSGITDSVAAYMIVDQTLSGGTKLELWAGVMGVRMRDELFAKLREVDVRVRHVTILPSVLHTLYSEIGSGPPEGALMICLPEGPLSGFFHEGKLRLILESPLTPEDSGTYAALCVDQFERGALFLKQQFRGTRLDALLLAAESNIWNDVAGQVRATHDLQVLPLGDPRERMSSLLALGTAVDAEVHPTMNLGASGTRSARDVLKKLARASHVVVSAAALFALLQLGRMTRLESQVAERDDLAWGYHKPLTAMMSTARARLNASQNTAALESVLQQNGSLQSVLSGLASAAPETVQLDSVEITRRGATWDAIVIGHTRSNSYADGVRELSHFFRSLTAQPSLQEVQVEDFTYLPAPGATGQGTGVRFKLLFKAETGS